MMRTYQILLRGDDFVVDGRVQDFHIFAFAEAESLGAAITLVIEEAKKLHPWLKQDEAPQWPHPVINPEECYDLEVVNRVIPRVYDLDVSLITPYRANQGA